MAREYIQNNIIPIYNKFDKAHDISHVRQVIENSAVIARGYPIDPDMVYTIAAYHDVGLLKGRKDHEKNSAAFLLADKNIREYFDDEQMIIMAEAIEDHRASCVNPPRSIYGKIVADADNDLDYNRVLTRCLWYGLVQFPEYDKDTHFERIMEHMHEKYGHDGYLKIFLNSDKDVCSLQMIRDKLDSPAEMRADFNSIWAMRYGSRRTKLD